MGWVDEEDNVKYSKRSNNLMCRSQALGIVSFASRVSSMLAPFTSLLVRMLLYRSFRLLTRKNDGDGDDDCFYRTMLC